MELFSLLLLRFFLVIFLVAFFFNQIITSLGVVTVKFPIDIMNKSSILLLPLSSKNTDSPTIEQ
jgi:hypothetical protein